MVDDKSAESIFGPASKATVELSIVSPEGDSWVINAEPRDSTLLALASALAGRESLRKVLQQAVDYFTVSPDDYENKYPIRDAEKLNCPGWVATAQRVLDETPK